MVYELWDTEIGHGLARLDSAQEMASLVDGLVTANGTAYAGQLSLIIEHGSAEENRLLAGGNLLAWCRGVRDVSPDTRS